MPRRSEQRTRFPSILAVEKPLIRRFVGAGARGTDTEIDQDRGRNEDRRIGADQHDVKDHGRDETADRMAAEQKQRQQGKRTVTCVVIERDRVEFNELLRRSGIVMRL